MPQNARDLLAVISVDSAMLSSFRLHFFYAACLIAIAGCAVGPDFHKPMPPKDAGYTTAPLPAATVSTDVPSGDAQRFVNGLDLQYKWWEAFGSPAIN